MNLNKKAAMELGINAIVILIIALAILGLAMGFVTNLFGSGEDQLDTYLKKEQISAHADAYDSFIFDPSEIKVKAGKEEYVTVAIYNKMDTDADVELTLDEDACIAEEDEFVEGFNVISYPKKIISGDEGAFKIKFAVEKGTPSGTYICNIQATLDGASETDVYEQQIFVTVTA